MHEATPARPIPARTEFMTNEAALRGLRCAEALYPPGLRLPRHAHEQPFITIIAAGSLVELQGRALASVLAPRLRRALASRERASALLAEDLALEVLALVLPPERLPEPLPAAWLARVHDRIRAEFREDVSVAELAREARVHPVHLARAFRAEYGLSPAELARALRIEWAAEELARGERPIGVIALEAGFYDQSHLTRAFRAAKGASPGAYRRARRG
jgi:AraC-like DNA-binding protein